MNQKREEQLQKLAESLPFTEGRFSADDVRVRLGRSAAPRGRRWGLAAAAVLALVLTHTGAFLLGGRAGVEEPPPDPLVETERILTRASHLDASAPHDLLRDELGDLRRDIHLASLPDRLDTLDDRRARRFADALNQVEMALDSFQDPGLSVTLVAGIARATLANRDDVRLLPASAKRYTQVFPLGEGRFRFVVVDISRGVVLQDEGTPQELRGKYPQIRFVSGD